MMPITPIVKHLLILNVVFFIATALLPPEFHEMVACWPPGDPNFRPYQIITYMFAHADISHILFNMLSLFFLGPLVEMTLGPKRFLGLYFISGFTALVAHFAVWYFLFLPSGVYMGPILGASGAVFGVTIAFATLFPDRQLMLLFPPIPIKAWLMAVILVAIGLYQGITGGGNIAHFAHLGGA
ncbi:MAG: rhomboid family intramembrane serine protease, partial [Saprospiraceae bacterium]